MLFFNPIAKSVFFILFYLPMLCTFPANAQAMDNITVKVSGIEGKLLENVNNHVRLLHTPLEKLKQNQILFFYENSDQEFMQALRPYGYYHIDIEKSLNAPDQKHKEWQILFNIKLNQAVRIKQLNLQFLGDANNDPKMLLLMENFPLAKGDILNHQIYAQGKQSILALAKQRGYFDAKFIQHRVQVFKQKKLAQIDLNFDSGKRYRFGKIVFEQDYFNNKLLARLTPFKTGEPYHKEKITRLQNTLMDTHYFSKVTIDEAFKLIDHNAHVDLLIRTTAKRKNSYRGRIGYGTDTGIRIGADAKYHFLNSFGHSLHTGLGYTLKRKKHLAKISYLIPQGNDAQSFMRLFSDYRAEDFRSKDMGIEGIDGKSRVSDISLGIEWKHSRYFLFKTKLKEKISVEYLSENYRLMPLLFTQEDQDILNLIAEDPLLKGNLFPEQGISVLTPNINVLSLGLNWKFHQADNRIIANHGYSIEWGVKGALKGLGSDVSYLQSQLKTKYIYRLSPQSRMLLRGEVGLTKAEMVDFLGFNIVQLPKLLLFATGGSNTIRGFDFEQLNGQDSLPRAKNLLLGSIEYEYEFMPKWSMAVFYDIGNVYNKLSTFDPQSGTGIGIRWHSPIGMVRLDIAYAYKSDYSPFRVHFSLGPDF